MIYAGIEHLIRHRLTETNTFFPDMKKKPTQRPTAKWVFFCFQGVSVVLIDNQIQIVYRYKKKQILQCLYNLMTLTLNQSDAILIYLFIDFL